MKDNILVVGGGAGGLMAACTAAQAGAQVTLIEKNARIGRKLLISGKGRCNLTNNQTDVRYLMEQIPGNGRFLYSAFANWMPHDQMDFIEALGVPLKTERGNRVFPVSDQSKDIVDAFDRCLKQCGVKRILEDRVTGLQFTEDRITGVQTEHHGLLPCTACILATGGCTYPRTGSTGDGYQLAKEAGHTVTPLHPCLVPLVSKDPACQELQGLSLKNVHLSLYQSGKKKPLYQELGEMLFTHFGVSGPLVLSASSHLPAGPGPETFYLEIDLKPGLTEEQLDKRIQRDFEDNVNKAFQNALSRLLPSSMIPVIVQKSGIPAEKKVHQITKEERHSLVYLLKHYRIPITGCRPMEEGIVTGGGVSLKEVNPKTMESKLKQGLYFAGELLDLDAYTGGYNLQIAFSTGHLAGESAAKESNHV